MVQCSNPIQCQLAVRDYCSCACGGSNHSKLRQLLDNDDPSTQAEGEEKLAELKKVQEGLKKTKRLARRQKRAEAKKSTKGVG